MPNQVAALIADYQSGMTITDIAARYHVHWETAQRWLKVNDVPIRGVAALSGEAVQEAAALRAEGWTWHQLGARFGRSHTAIRNAVVKL